MDRQALALFQRRTVATSRFKYAPISFQESSRSPFEGGVTFVSITGWGGVTAAVSRSRFVV